MTKSGVASTKWNLFNWYFLSLGLASLCALTILVYTQDNTGWGWGFGIPTIIMLISIIAFVLDPPHYKIVKPDGSPLVRLAQVVVEAIKKRKEALADDPNLLYQNWSLMLVFRWKEGFYTPINLSKSKSNDWFKQILKYE